MDFSTLFKIINRSGLIMLLTTTGWIVFGALAAYRLVLGFLKGWESADDNVKSE